MQKWESALPPIRLGLSLSPIIGPRDVPSVFVIEEEIRDAKWKKFEKK